MKETKEISFVVLDEDILGVVKNQLQFWLFENERT